MSNIFILLKADHEARQSDIKLVYKRNRAIREILKRQANRVQTTEDIQTLQTYHDQLPNGLSRAYLATLLRGTIDSFYDFNKRLVHTDPMSLDCFDNCFPYNLNPLNPFDQGQAVTPEASSYGSLYACFPRDIHRLPSFFHEDTLMVDEKSFLDGLYQCLHYDLNPLPHFFKPSCFSRDKKTKLTIF